ncbi:aminodeoxychorismate synthase component I [Spartinivicinus poritis]|uniref:aminodeoxychorismate synthase n=1 Tax=Spartinivicinus poritis TaxID=2994640 RepID=A0ABT5U6E1_9GAMM|nr:aminodeoxychorismate synthase component I [Spartinivicinus sp. A2-2]MDE1460754.1 aminodeoxychorismate synthase component I [Spartinivicinus sp. A2-2]
MKQATVTAVSYSPNSLDYFLALRHMPFPAWLDSTNGKHVDGRFDIITANPRYFLHYQKGSCTLQNLLSGESKLLQENPFVLQQQLFEQFEPIACHWPFVGGWLGYWGYDLKAVTEPQRFNHQDDEWPCLMAGLYLWAVVVDHQQQQAVLVAHPSLSREEYQQLQECLTKLAPAQPPQSFKLTKPFQPVLSQAQYQAAFKQIQHYIQAGDCYQVNFTQRFDSQFCGDLLTAYSHLRKTSPAPFSAYLGFGEITVLSHSPERFIKADQYFVETKPIKGTRARSTDPEIDRLQAEALLNSEKDRAENLMIVDLLRNDLSKHCSQVKVPHLFELESFANVHHLVTTVTGQLHSSANYFDLLTGAFPGGSITGAPKIRAMEIIQQLEPVSRSVYCGAIGYISFNQQMDTNIAIRTLVAKGQGLYCWGGGGIVADSKCEDEYQEAWAKVSNLMNALNQLK